MDQISRPKYHSNKPRAIETINKINKTQRPESVFLLLISTEVEDLGTYNLTNRANKKKPIINPIRNSFSLPGF
jgi:hypothetical protein